MGSWGLWFLGEADKEKREVLVKEVSKLYKVDVELAKKGFEALEKVLKENSVSE